MNLYKLTGELLSLERHIEDAETPDEMDACLAAMFELEGLRDRKLEACLYVRKNLQALADARIAEAKKMRELAEQSEKKVASLDDYVARCLKPGEKFDCPIGSFGWRKSTKCEPLESNYDESAPSEYVKFVPKVLVSAIKDAIKAGKEVAGWTVREYQNLQVK